MSTKLPVASCWLSLASLVVRSVSCTSAEAERYDCAKAIRIATAGYSGRKMQPAVDELLPCGASGADAAAIALLSTRAERDTAVLGLNETRPVDSTYVAEVRALGRRLANDAANPRDVRRAATCLELIPKGWRAPKPYTPFDTRR